MTTTEILSHLVPNMAWGEPLTDLSKAGYYTEDQEVHNKHFIPYTYKSKLTLSGKSVYWPRNFNLSHCYF